jgi:hypothetical protein
LVDRVTRLRATPRGRHVDRVHFGLVARLGSRSDTENPAGRACCGVNSTGAPSGRAATMSVHTGSITRRGHLRKRCLAPRRDGAGERIGRLAQWSRWRTLVWFASCPTLVARAVRKSYPARSSQPDDMMLNRTPDPGRPPCCPGPVPTTWPTARYQRHRVSPWRPLRARSDSCGGMNCRMGSCGSVTRMTEADARFRGHLPRQPESFPIRPGSL